MDTLRSNLEDILRGKVTIVGMGNVMRGDDGFGPVISERLKGRISAEVVNAGFAPENYLKKISDSKPDTILIIDAADFGGAAGDIKLFKKDDIPLYGISTHNASPALFLDFLEADTEAYVYMLAVQPERNDMDAQLSTTLALKLKDIESLLSELLPKDPSRLPK